MARRRGPTRYAIIGLAKFLKERRSKLGGIQEIYARARERAAGEGRDWFGCRALGYIFQNKKLEDEFVAVIDTSGYKKYIARAYRLARYFSESAGRVRRRKRWS